MMAPSSDADANMLSFDQRKKVKLTLFSITLYLHVPVDLYSIN